MTKGEKISKKLKGNKNAESWTLDEAVKMFDKAIKLSNKKANYPRGEFIVEGYEFDFVGEIARELKTYRDVFDYLSDKYKELIPKHRTLLANLEANCFANTKKGIIREATGIVNLKSNYKWTDRVDTNNHHSGEIIIKPPKLEDDN